LERTFDIIRALDNGAFPPKAAINIHPQRWNDNPYDWTKELVLQNVKNVVKLGLLKSKLKIEYRILNIEY
jgi:hypothetical protein